MSSRAEFLALFDKVAVKRGAAVTPVTQASEDAGNSSGRPESQQNQALLASVTPVTPVTRENEGGAGFEKTQVQDPASAPSSTAKVSTLYRNAGNTGNTGNKAEKRCVCKGFPECEPFPQPEAERVTRVTPKPACPFCDQPALYPSPTGGYVCGVRGYYVFPAQRGRRLSKITLAARESESQGP
jgi:hypothetical protein